MQISSSTQTSPDSSKQSLVGKQEKEEVGRPDPIQTTYQCNTSSPSKRPNR